MSDSSRGIYSLSPEKNVRLFPRGCVWSKTETGFVLLEFGFFPFGIISSAGHCVLVAL